MDELIEQVKRAMYDTSPQPIFDEDGSTIGHVPWEEFTPAPFTWEGNDDLAIAAIRAVRAFDLAVGPTEAEIDRADWAYLNARKNGHFMSADCMERGLGAAAAERARVVEGGSHE